MTERTMGCVDLRKLAGDRYRTDYDPAYRPQGRTSPDLWMIVIPCRYGEIYPSGGDKLRVDIRNHNKVASWVSAIPGCRLVQDGDQEKAIEFPVSLFDEVAKRVKPRRRRQVTLAERSRLLEIGMATQFQVPSSTAVSPSCPRAESSGQAQTGQGSVVLFEAGLGLRTSLVQGIDLSGRLAALANKCGRTRWISLEDSPDFSLLSSVSASRLIP